MARYSSKGNALSLPPVMNNALLYSAQAMESPTRADIERWRAAGIPGIKYLDQGSRTKGEGTRNLVVFDDNIITIKSVNGEPVR